MDRCPTCRETGFETTWLGPIEGYQEQPCGFCSLGDNTWFATVDGEGDIVSGVTREEALSAIRREIERGSWEGWENLPNAWIESASGARVYVDLRGGEMLRDE